MDKSIKAAIAHKRSKMSEDPAFNRTEEDTKTDEENHRDLAPDVGKDGEHSSHVGSYGANQNVNPTRSGNVGYHNKPLSYKSEALGDQDEKIGQQDHMGVNPKKTLVPAGSPNDGRLMSGDGSDPQHDEMGVDVHKGLRAQGDSLSKGNLSKASHLKTAFGKTVGNATKVDMSDPGHGEDVGDASATVPPSNGMNKVFSSKMRGGLEAGSDPDGMESNQSKYTHKPMAKARESMNKFGKKY